MPVEEIEVHEKTRVGSDFRYGCHNKPRTREPYLAPNGYVATHDRRTGGNFSMVKMDWVKDTSSIDCRNALSLKEDACEGCQWRGVAEKYWEEYRKRIDSH